MRILVIANAMNTLSGGDKRFVEIFRRLAKKGNFVKIMLPKVGHILCNNEHLDVSYQLLPFKILNKLGPVSSNFLRTFLGLILVMKNVKKFDIVYSSSDFLNDVVPSFFLKLFDRNVKWVAVTHYLIPLPSKRDGSFLANFVSFFTQRISIVLMKHFADEVITSSLFLKLQLVSLGVETQKIQVGSNGVDVKLVDSIPSYPSRCYDACFAARLHRSKGVYDVIDAWELVCKSKSDARLVMVGYGTDEVVTELRGIISKKGLTRNIDLVGFRKSSGVYDLMKQSKLFLYGDTENGWGIAMAEAMAAKCVVIAYDLEVYHEVYGDSIVYVPWRNISKFAEKIVSLLSDEKLVFEMGEQSRDFVSRYDWDVIAQGELKNLRRVLS